MNKELPLYLVKTRSDQLFNLHAKGGDAVQKTVILEMNRKLSINH